MDQSIKAPTEKELEALLLEAVATTGVPGIGVAVNAGGSVSSAYVGRTVVDEPVPLSQDSRFEISCLMKFFLSLVTLELARKGVVDLDAAVSEIMPELSDEMNREGRDIKVCHLLSHTSGYRGLDISDMKVRWSYSWGQFVRHYLKHERQFAPGVMFNYEHSEHVVLGQLLHRITNRTARQLVTDTILRPLCVTPGSAAADKRDATVFTASHARSGTDRYRAISIPPFGPFWDPSLPDWTMTISQIAAVAAALLGLQPDGSVPGVFHESTLEQLKHPFITLPRCVSSDPRAEELPRSFGIGCAQYAAGKLGHNGSAAGQTCGLRIDPDNRTVVVVGLNAWAPHVRDTVLRRISERLVSSAPVRKEDHAPKYRHEEILGDFDLDEVTGFYVGSYLGEVNVTRNGSVLILDVGPPGNRRHTIRITPAQGDLYTIDSNSPVSIAFVRPSLSSDPALVLGMHSYKKQAGEGGE